MHMLSRDCAPASTLSPPQTR